MTDNWIKMFKGDEEKLVHPGNVENHKRFGWKVFGEPDEIPAEEGYVDYLTPVKLIKDGKVKIVASGEISNYEHFGWVIADQDSALSDDEVIAKINAATTIAELYAFQTPDRSLAVEEAINAKGNELNEAEIAAARAGGVLPGEINTGGQTVDEVFTQSGVNQQAAVANGAVESGITAEPNDQASDQESAPAKEQGTEATS